MAVATWVANGTAVTSTGSAISPAWPAHQQNDIAFLFVETAGGSAISLSTASGFVQIGTTQSTGTSTGGTKLAVYWCRATGTAMAAPTVGATTDHLYGVIVTYRGGVSTGNPISANTGGVKASASTSVSMPGVTTLFPNEKVIYALARDNDSASAALSSQANTSVTSILERFDAGTADGGGGGIAVTDATKAVAGATGTMTGSITSSINAYVTFSIIPSEPPVITPNTADATDFGTDTTPSIGFVANDTTDLTYNIQIDNVNTFDSASSISGDTNVTNAYYYNNPNFTSSTSNRVIGGTSTTVNATQAAGESFVPASTFTATGIKLRLAKVGSPSDGLLVEILTSSISTGTVIASGTYSNVSSLTTTMTYYTINFSSAVTLTGGTTYFIRITRTPDIENTTNYVNVGGAANGTRFPGTFQFKFNNSWSADTGDDIFFALQEKGGIINANSSAATGFANVITSTDTQPFTPNQNMEYTVQSALDTGTYFWRSRAIDTTESNYYSAWSATRSFSVSSATPVTVTKTLQYAIVKSYSPTKSLKYTIKSSPTASIKSLKYSIKTAGVPVVKNLSYSIRKDYSITKSLEYRLKTTPTGASKSLAYNIKLPSVSIAKSLKYAVKTVSSPTKSLSYKIKTTPTALSKSLTYQLKVNANVTKSLIYKIKPSAIVLKTLKYSLKVNSVVSKSLQYSVKTSTPVNKSLTYTVVSVTTSIVNKSLKYSIRLQGSINKSLKYSVKKALIVTKSLKYSVKLGNAIPKSLTYQIKISQTAISKSLSYKIRIGLTVNKSLKYTILRASTAITKSLQYALRPGVSVSKTLKYSVKVPQTPVSKSLKYSVKGSVSVSKSLKYSIRFITTISKSLSYSIRKQEVLLKSLKYSVKTAGSVNKNLTYVISQATVQVRQLRYNIRVNNTLLKSLSYKVRVSGALQKSLSYRITGSSKTISKALNYSIRSQSTALKSLKYTLRSFNTVIKNLKYSVVVRTNITKNLKYFIVKSSTVTKQLVYKISGFGSVSKSLRYIVRKPSITLNRQSKYFVKVSKTLVKGMEYRIKKSGSVISKGMRYRIRAKKRNGSNLLFTLLV